MPPRLAVLVTWPSPSPSPSDVCVQFGGGVPSVADITAALPPSQVAWMRGGGGVGIGDDGTAAAAAPLDANSFAGWAFPPASPAAVRQIDADIRRTLSRLIALEVPRVSSASSSRRHEKVPLVSHVYAARSVVRMNGGTTATTCDSGSYRTKNTTDWPWLGADSGQFEFNNDDDSDEDEDKDEDKDEGEEVGGGGTYSKRCPRHSRAGTSASLATSTWDENGNGNGGGGSPSRRRRAGGTFPRTASANDMAGGLRDGASVGGGGKSPGSASSRFSSCPSSEADVAGRVCSRSAYVSGVSLRRLLLALASHAPALGYCQGFNVLAAHALRWCGEADSLAIVTSIIAHVFLPDTFCDLAGAAVDQAAMGELLASALPELVGGLAVLEGGGGGGGCRHRFRYLAAALRRHARRHRRPHSRVDALVPRRICRGRLAARADR